MEFLGRLIGMCERVPMARSRVYTRVRSCGALRSKCNMTSARTSSLKTRNHLSKSPVRWKVRKLPNRALRDAHEFSVFPDTPPGCRTTVSRPIACHVCLPGVCAYASLPMVAPGGLGRLSRWHIFASFFLYVFDENGPRRRLARHSRLRPSAPAHFDRGCRSRGRGARRGGHH